MLKGRGGYHEASGFPTRFGSLQPFDVIFHQASITDTTVHDQMLQTHDNVEGFRRLLEFLDVDPAYPDAWRKPAYYRQAELYFPSLEDARKGMANAAIPLARCMSLDRWLRTG